MHITFISSETLKFFKYAINIIDFGTVKVKYHTYKLYLYSRAND